MNTEEKNNSSETNNSEPIKNQSKFKGKLVAFLKNNKAATVLTILLLIVFVWFSIKIRINDNKFNNEKTQLITQYESKIDSLNVDHIKFATEVFSWSVRSELLRENSENLNQLLTTFVKQSGANIVQLINPKENIVLLSSDKKFEGSLASESSDYSELSETIVLKKDNTTKIISPVMGYNEKIGVLIVELKQEEEKIKENNTNS
ncbi:MAG: hypothetical protein U9Q83_01670 [Bacteroidota bacterium]|nr:hypothetical protein [Bacteroidota bacterium]